MVNRRKHSKNIHVCHGHLPLCGCEEGDNGDNDLPPPKSWFFELTKKFGIQLLIIGAFFLVYKFLKIGLPKKYRMKEGAIKNFITTTTELVSHLPSEGDQPMNTLEKAYRVFEFLFWQGRVRGSYHNDFREFIDELEEEVEIVRSDIFAKVIFPKIEQEARDSRAKQMLDEEGTAKIFKYVFNQDGKDYNIYLIRYSGDGETDRISFDPLFAVTKGLDYKKLSNILFQITENRLYLFLNRRNEIDAEKLSHENNSRNFQLDEGFAESLTKEIDTFRLRNLQRSYIFFGPPGTGKTTTALELSKKSSNGKILKLEARVFERMSSSAARILIENMDCNYIIVDDIDRMHTVAISNFLYTLEALKDYKNKPTLIATANNLEVLNSAILRPGRFDELIEFKLPDPEKRKEIINFLVSDLGVTLEEAEVVQLVKLTTGMSQAYIKEYCQQLANGEEFAKVKEKIKFRKALIEKIEKKIGGVSKNDEPEHNLEELESED